MKILSHEMAKYYQVSSLSRGHVVFTSFISKNGKILFLENHIARLLEGANYLFPECSWDKHAQEIQEYVLKIFLSDRSDAYFRLTIFDDNIHLEHRSLMPFKNEVKLTSAVKRKTAGLIPCFLKNSNYLESDLELKRASELGFDDILFFDEEHRLTEASTSNVFVLGSDGIIRTPGLSSKVLAGVTRFELIKWLKKEGHHILETDVFRTELEAAHEIWLTNAVKGVRLVSRFENQHYKISETFYEKIIEHFGKHGELV